MIDGLKRYPSMKDSGVPWLGAVPKHWEVLRLGALLRERGETNDDNSTTEVLSVMRERGVIPYAEKGNVGNKKSEDITRYKIVRPNDIVVNCMNVIIGSVGLSDYTGCLSPVYYVLTRRSKADDPHYLNAYFQTKPFQLSLVRIGNGILAHRMRIPMELLKCEPFPRPPADEQAAIVRFLHHADRRIQRYIRAKRKLIKLLEEQKQATIHRAVTRSLDSNIKLKPSGVEWLGDMPEHWNLKRFKFLARVTSGQVDPRAPEQRGKILIAPNHIKSGSGRISLEETAEGQGADSGKYEVRRGQVVYSKIRPNLRTAAIARVDCLCSADMYPLTVRESELRPEFLLLILLSVPFTRFVVDCSLRVAMPKVNREALGEGWLWYPDLKEQDAILRSTQESTSPLDMAIGQAEREIALVREYRTRLIADVVTGKLDVREAAARLPEEAVEVEPLDEIDDLPQDDSVAEEPELEASDAV